jgi:hypothetical protein
MFTNKTLSILLILIFSVCLFMTNAMAGGCEGGPSCFKCGQMDHHHPAILETGLIPTGCQPGTPGDTCGITAGRILDNLDFLASVTRVENHPDTVSPAAAAFKFPTDLFLQKPISPDQPLVVTKAPPIYLSNLTLLC